MIQIALNDSELRIYEICCHLKKLKKKMKKKLDMSFFCFTFVVEKRIYNKNTMI